jgi:fermentation-respiration switch protein FrsA (DUF1100 family)
MSRSIGSGDLWDDGGSRCIAEEWCTDPHCNVLACADARHPQLHLGGIKPCLTTPADSPSRFWLERMNQKAHYGRVSDKRAFVSNLISIVAMAAGVYVLVVLLVYAGQSRLLYFPNIPSRTLGPGPDSIGLAYQPVELLTDDGVRLDAWFVPARVPRGVVLFFHGNAGNISHRLDSLKIFHDLSLSTLIFDYRGYGRSQGKASEEGTYRDAEAAWRYLTVERRIPASRIILFGRSLGAAIAARLASRQQPAALIIESGFVSVPELAGRLYPWLPVRWLARFKYATSTHLKHLSVPVLIIHSRDDEIIPFDQGRSLFESAHEPKHFMELRGGHNDGFLASGQHYVDGLDAFLVSALGE